MKIHIVTIGKPKLHYAHLGWNEYMWRLEKFHKISVTHLADKYANDTAKILEASAGTFRIGLIIDGEQMDSPHLARLFERLEMRSRPVSFIIGGPEGLPEDVKTAVDLAWSLSPLTFPHDLAMVITLEAIYRASTINAHVPYHK